MTDNPDVLTGTDALTIFTLAFRQDATVTRHTARLSREQRATLAQVLNIVQHAIDVADHATCPKCEKPVTLGRNRKVVGKQPWHVHCYYGPTSHRGRPA